MVLRVIMAYPAPWARARLGARLPARLLAAAGPASPRWPETRLSCHWYDNRDSQASSSGARIVPVTLNQIFASRVSVCPSHDAQSHTNSESETQCDHGLARLTVTTIPEHRETESNFRG